MKGVGGSVTDPSKELGEASAPGLGTVCHVGAMSNVMRKGILSASIRLDALEPAHLFAVGPVENLRGEITILDGTAYIATLTESGAETIHTTCDVGAPFMVYAHVSIWGDSHPVPAVKNLPELEAEIAAAAQSVGLDLDIAFPFWIQGTIAHAKYHVIWRDPGAGPHSPEQHAKAKIYFNLAAEPADIIGFYSRHHAGIFTHHDSAIHAHVINQRRTRMGHLDEIAFDSESVTIRFPTSMANSLPV